MKLIFATGNSGKLREAREILAPAGIEVVSPYDLGLTKEQVDIEETGSSFEENAILKVRLRTDDQLKEALTKPAISW